MTFNGSLYLIYVMIILSLQQQAMLIALDTDDVEEVGYCIRNVGQV